MSILYILTSPEPEVEGTDAVFQEIQTLQTAYEGDRINLFPLKKPSSILPKLFYGLNQIKSIKKQESKYKINHIFVPTLHYLPIFNYMSNPIVYTVVASLQDQKKPAHINKLNKLHKIVVSNERDQQILKSWGIYNYSIIHPGIDISKFQPYSLPLEKELTVLMASAPWEKAQFHSKGIDLLLETTAKYPFLKLILLWRGLLLEELQKKIDYYGVKQKVEVINRRVNVNDILKKVHATILLAKHSYLVKAFPHSLIESLAAGKPVIVSNTIPIADFIREHGCGIVLDEFRLEMLIQSIDQLTKQYQQLANNAKASPVNKFSIERMIDQYGIIYRSK